VEGKALVAAIDLIGDHLPEGALESARAKIVEALGEDPTRQLLVARAAGDDADMARVINRAIADRRVLEVEYYKPDADAISVRRIEPMAFRNGLEGWYVKAYEPADGREVAKAFRLDRLKRAEITEETFEPRHDLLDEDDAWLRTGAVEASRIARVWVSPERARWEREERPVAAELADGAVVVEVPFKGTDWLVREVLEGAGDLAVLEPADAREAVAQAAASLRETVAAAT
jgi:proteasome accessory factor C